MSETPEFWIVFVVVCLGCFVIGYAGGRRDERVRWTNAYWRQALRQIDEADDDD